MQVPATIPGWLPDYLTEPLTNPLPAGLSLMEFTCLFALISVKLTLPIIPIRFCTKLRVLRSWIMFRNHTVFITAILLLAVLICGCGKDPTIPPAGPDQTSKVQDTPADRQNHTLLGWYNIAINTETWEMDIIPVRTSDLHLNLTGVMNATSGMSIALVPAECDFPTGLIVFDMTLTHPIADAPQFTAFDMRGTMMTPGSLVVDDVTFADFNETRVENADGYSRWWNPTEFTTSGVFGYTIGSIAYGPTSGLTATVNPYKLFADILYPNSNLGLVGVEPLDSPEGRAVFSSGESNTRRYYMRFEMNPGINLLYGYAIDCCWDIPNPNPPSNVPADFPFTANSNEAFRIAFAKTVSSLYYDSESGLSGGVLRFNINVHDWQGLDTGLIQNEIASISLKSPDLLTSDYSPVFVEEDAYRAIYAVDLTGIAIPSRAGLNQIICEVVSSDGTTYKQAVPPAPEVPVSAYHVLAVEVIDPECTTDTNNDWTEASPISPGEPIIDQLCGTTDYKDFYQFTIDPGFEITGDLRLFIDIEPTNLGIFIDDQSMVAEDNVSSGVATINFDDLDLLPGSYYVRVWTSNISDVAPYLLEMTGDFVDVTPLDPVDITPDGLYCDPNDIYFHQDYLYMTGYAATWVYDVTDPSNPTQISDSPITVTTATCFQYPYLYYLENGPVMGDEQVSMIDFTNPSAPVEYVAVINFPQTNTSGIQVHSPYLYVGAGSDVIIYDIGTTPTSPVEVNTVSTALSGQLLEILDPDGPNTRLIKGNYNSIYSYNIEDPLSISATGSYIFITGSLRDIDVHGEYIIASVEIAGDGWLYAFQQYTNTIGFKGSVDIPGDSRQLELNWPYAYIAGGNEGMTICDLTTIASPSHVSTTGLIGDCIELTSNGNYVYAIPWNAGMQVIDVSIPVTPVPLARLQVINAPYSMVLKDNYLIIAEIGQGGFSSIKVLDISNAPDFQFAHEMYPGFRPTGLAINGNTLLAASQDKSWITMDVTDPQNIIPKSQTFESNYIYELAVMDNTAYIYINMVGHPVKIYDITDLTTPIYKNTMSHANGVRDFNFVDNLMYIAQGANIDIYSLTNPFFPAFVDTYSVNPTGYSDTEIRNNFLYIVGQNFLEIADISTPTAPVFLGSTALPEQNNTFNFIAVEGQFAYVDGFSEKLYSCWVYPPDSPEVLGNFYPEVSHSAKDLVVHEGILYEAGSGGLHIYDLY